MLDVVRSKQMLIKVGVITAILLALLLVIVTGRSNAAPLVKASADKTSGTGPLQVAFSSKGTKDPENDKLTYRWSFGDNTTSTKANPVKTYDTEGKYAVKLKVSDGEHTVSAKTITITVTEALVLGAETPTVVPATTQVQVLSTHVTVKPATLPAPASHQVEVTPVVPGTPTTPVEPPVVVAPNLIPNASLLGQYSEDTPLYWIKGGYGDNSAVYVYEAMGRTDERSVSVTLTDYVFGDAKWIFEPVSVTGGLTYTFSNWYKATVQTEMVVEYTHADDSKTYEWLGFIDPATEWTQLSKDLVTPDTATHVSVYHVLRSAGTLQTDDYALIVQ